MLPGPPYAITRTAICSAAMHEIHDRPHRRDVRLREYAVTEVENVAGSSTGARQDVADLTGALCGGREQHRGLEIALDRAISDASPGGVQRYPPVDADDVAARCREIFEKRGGPRTEVNERNSRCARERKRLPAVQPHSRKALALAGAARVPLIHFGTGTEVNERNSRCARER